MKTAIAAPRQNIFLLDPTEVILIGLDTADGPAHPRYDVRVHNQYEEEVVQGMMEFGAVECVKAVKVATVIEVVDGRQRVINCREANRRLAELGLPLLRVRVLLVSGSDARLAALTVLLNEHRREDTPYGKAQKAQKLLDMGRSIEEVAMIFKASVQTINNYLSLLTLPAEIQTLVMKGEVNPTKGYQLATKSAEAQKAFLTRRENGNRSGEHKTRAVNKKTLQKVLANGGHLPEEFLLGIKFALGLVSAEDITGVAAAIEGNVVAPIEPSEGPESNEVNALLN